MGVPPPDEIVIADVHSAGISDFSVYHHYLPVVAVVELRDEIYERPSRLGELHHFHPGILHFVVVPRTDCNVGDVFMYEPHLHSFPGFLHQHFLDLLAALVLTEIEIFHVDIFLCIPQVLYEQVELPSSGRDDFETVTVRHASGGLCGQKLCESLVFAFYEIVRSMPEQQFMHLCTGPRPEHLNEFPVLLLEEPRLPEVDSHHKIENEADNREQCDDQYPGNLLGGVPVIEYDDYHCPQNHKGQE